MCKHSSGCGTSDTITCKSCGTKMCKGCHRNWEDGTPVKQGNSAACGKCGAQLLTGASGLRISSRLRRNGFDAADYVMVKSGASLSRM